MTDKCEIIGHDFKNLKRLGRAKYICPKCGEDVTLLLVVAADAGIDITGLYPEIEKRKS